MDAFIKSYIEDRAQEELIELIKKAQKKRNKERFMRVREMNRLKSITEPAQQKFNFTEHLKTLTDENLDQLLTSTEYAKREIRKKLMNRVKSPNSLLIDNNEEVIDSLRAAHGQISANLKVIRDEINRREQLTTKKAVLKVLTESEFLGNTEEQPNIVILNLYHQDTENAVQGFLNERGQKSFEGYVYDYEITYKGETKRTLLNTNTLLPLNELQELILQLFKRNQK